MHSEPETQSRPVENKRGFRRKQRPWGLLAFVSVLVAFGVSEALGARGALAPSSIQGSASEARETPEAPDGAEPVLTAPAPDPEPAPNGPSGTSPDIRPDDDYDYPDDVPDDPGPDPTPPPPPPPPPAPDPPPEPEPPRRPVLVSNDGGQALFSFPSLGADRVMERCVTVKYTGPRDAEVHLFAPRWGTGLDRYLRMTVTRGTSLATQGGPCTAFNPDAQSYAGAGPGVLYSGRLAGFPETLEAADGAHGPATWQSGESHTYRVRVAIVSANAAQGKSTNFELVWQARP